MFLLTENNPKNENYKLKKKNEHFTIDKIGLEFA